MLTIVITGASSGIGLELTKLYLERGEDVIAVCRKQTPELVNTNATIVDGIDLCDDDCYSILSSALEGRKVDVLINNAGVFLNETLESMPFSQLSTQFEINTVAPMKVTMALLKNLFEGSKIIMTTSRMGSIADNSGGGYYGYRGSKAALNAVAVSLSVDLKPRGISVRLVHPGFVKTKMTGFNGDISPHQSAQGYLKLVDELDINHTGEFWHVNGEQLPW